MAYTMPVAIARRMSLRSHLRDRGYVFALVGAPRAEGEGGLACSKGEVAYVRIIVFPFLDSIRDLVISNKLLFGLWRLIARVE